MHSPTFSPLIHIEPAQIQPPPEEDAEDQAPRYSEQDTDLLDRGQNSGSAYLR